jgi:hypothetical protein
MKSNCLLSRSQLTAPSLLLGFALLLSVSASAQNLLNNPGFNAPLSTGNVTTNWVIGYDYGSKDDFVVADRTTWAKRTWGDADANGVAWGAQFRPIHEGAMKGYFKQTVSGLNTSKTYVVSGYMFMMWPQGIPNAYDVFIEARGNSGNLRTVSCNYSGPFNPATAPLFSVTNTPKANGTMEIRLYYEKKTWTTDKAYTATGCFDDISVTAQQPVD